MTAANSRIRSLTRCGLMIALFIVSTLIVIPLGPVPFTMQTAIVILCVLVLAPSETCATIGGYLILGAVGLPVFSGARGGLGVLVGPTGGFLIGFFIGALCAALVRQALMRKRPTTTPALANIAAAVIVLVVSYLFGWAQLMLVAHMDAGAAFAVGIAPFILLDTAKAALAIGVTRALVAGKLVSYSK